MVLLARPLRRYGNASAAVICPRSGGPYCAIEGACGDTNYILDPAECAMVLYIGSAPSLSISSGDVCIGSGEASRSAALSTRPSALRPQSACGTREAATPINNQHLTTATSLMQVGNRSALSRPYEARRVPMSSLMLPQKPGTLYPRLRTPYGTKRSTAEAAGRI